MQYAVIAETAGGSPAGGEEDDATLIQQSRDDPDRFAAIFDRHFDEIYRYVQRRVGASVAEDVAGETFLLAFQKRARYQAMRRDARPWLYGIATNLMHRHHRSEKRKYRAMQRMGGVDATHPEESHVERMESVVAARSARQQLAAALSDLRQGDRDVLLLIAWEELSYEEVAEALQIPVGTVRSRLNRARRKLRTKLGATDPTLATEETSHG